MYKRSRSFLVSAAELRTNKRALATRNRRIASLRIRVLILSTALITLILIFNFYHAGEKPITKHMPAVSSMSKSTAAQSDNTLNNIIATWAGKYSFGSSVFVQELTGSSPRSATYKATDSVVPASTYKIYVAYAILHGIEQGSYTLQTDTSDGNTIQTDLSNMILNSDNDAARTLGFLYGWQNIDALLKTQGATSTELNNYAPPSTDPVGDKRTTATDLATILRQLYQGKLLNESNTALLLNLMEQQQYRERIPAGVPSGVTVADKPGWLTGSDDGTTVVENDAAIVYGPKSTYILVITTNNNADTTPLADLSKSVYNYFEN